jgi:glycosyltransferase involved in cell wall biosynthesis
MKVLHVIPDVNGGGASKGAYRIHRSVLGQGIDSQLLVLKKNINDPNAININSGVMGWLGRKLNKKKNRAAMKSFSNFSTSNPALHSFGVTNRGGLLKRINQSDADIVHLHWIIHMLTIEEIGQISKPIVWTFHDMWPICGGEHYVLDDSDAARFRTGYLQCNQPSDERGPDYNRITWERKLAAWKSKCFHIATCSDWLANCARSSPLFANSYIEAINYPLDTAIFKPHEKRLVRDEFRLPLDKKIIMAGAVGGVNNIYKGGDLFRKAIEILYQQGRSDMIVVLFGEEKSAEFSDWLFPVINIGHIDSESQLSKLYSCADVFALPSRQEAFGQVGSEALASGTPVVAFRHSGPMDIVKHHVTGWLAKPFEPEDFATGISYLLDQQAQGLDLSSQARLSAVELFSLDVGGQKYVDLYKRTFRTRN